MHIIRDWFKRHFSDPQVLILAIILIAGAMVMLTVGRSLTPVLASIILAFLLDGLVGFLERWHVPRLAAVLIVFVAFMVFLLFLLLGLFPLLSRQVAQVLGVLPSMVANSQDQLMRLPERYPDLVSREQVAAMLAFIQTELGLLGKSLVSFSVASVRSLVQFLIYLVLMPLLVFFFLKDKELILHWLAGFLPEKRSLSNRVWAEVNQQFGNYMRGKFFEILIIWTVSYVTFSFLDLQFAMLNGLMVGLSVLVPYIGATVVTFPIALMALFQMGWGSESMAVVIAYAVIQLLDGNLLAPLLLSEVTKMHPVAIIVAVLVFGGLWGFWGVFFAIPLATLVNAVLRCWPGKGEGDDALPEAEAPAVTDH